MRPVLTDAQVEAWRTDGYITLGDLLDPDDVRQAREEAEALFPTREEYDRSRGGGPAVYQGMMFRSLPYAGHALNMLPFHGRVVAAAEQLLGTEDLRLTQSLLRATYCGPETVDQLLHRDFNDNTLLTPPREDGAYGQLPILIYLTDVGIGDAPTYVVSKRYSDDRPVDPSGTQWDTKDASGAGSWAARTREEDPELYSHEVANTGPAGTLLFYSMRTWHRGSAGHDPKGLRLVHHAVYRRRGYDWMDFTAWPPIFDNEHGRSCIERLTPRQRQLLGIPAPGDPFWTPETVRYFAARYPGADAQPYEAALA